MIRRRLRPAVLSLLVGTTLVGAALAGSTPAAAGGVPAVQIGHRDGVRVVEPDRDSRVVLDEQRAVESPDGRYVAVARALESGARTRIEVREGWGGALTWSRTVEGEWRPEAIAQDGAQVLLGSPAASRSPIEVPAGRSATPLTLVSKDAPARRYDLTGNFVAEAFVLDGRSAVLIEHLPAAAPLEYRVRRFDLLAAVMSDPVGSDKKPLPIERMRGVRQAAAWAPRGAALYTLYDASSSGAPDTVFVHALSLGTFGAVCLAVPAGIDAGRGRGSVAVANDGRELIVAGRKGIVRVNAATGAIEGRVMLANDSTPAIATMGYEMVIGSGRTLRRMTIADLRVVDTYRMPAAIRALARMPYSPVLVLDANADLWLAGPGLEGGPVRRGRLRTPVSGRVQLSVEPR